VPDFGEEFAPENGTAVMMMQEMPEVW